MKSIWLSLLVTMLILLNAVLSYQWRQVTSKKAVKSLKFITNNSASINFRGIEHDSETGDYFYLGFTLSPYGHFVSRMDYFGNLVWGRLYNASNDFWPSNNTLQYSPRYQALYYTINTNPKHLIKVNSSNGDILNSFEILGANSGSSKDRCSLSKDEQALFWNYVNQSNGRLIVRYDTNTSRIDIMII